jgi:hypothetical protein
MREGQRPRSSKLALPGVAALLGVCLWSLAGTPARAGESHPTPEPAPQSAPGTSPEGPRPDATPQPPQAPPSAGAAAPSAPSAPAEPSATPPYTRAAGAATTHAPPKHASHPRRRSSHATVHRPARHGHTPSRERKPARHLGKPSSAVAPPSVAASGHRDGTLLLAAALALGVVALAGASLLRLLTQFGRLSHEGPQ